jgi:hypothetical protein
LVVAKRPIARRPWKAGLHGRLDGDASRCMNCSGDVTMCVVPSRQGVFSSSITCRAAFQLIPLLDRCRAGDVAAKRRRAGVSRAAV